MSTDYNANIFYHQQFKFYTKKIVIDLRCVDIVDADCP